MTTLYWFLTDFVINFSNLLGISYLEGNGLIFGVMFPSYFFIMLLIGLTRRRLNQIKWNEHRKKRWNNFDHAFEKNLASNKHSPASRAKFEVSVSSADEGTPRVCEFCQKPLVYKLAIKF